MTLGRHSGFDRRMALKLLGGAASLTLAGRAMAADPFPPKILTLMNGYQPGGIVDITSRRIGKGLEGLWGTTVVIESRPGGNGMIAAGLAARSTPDGSMVLVTAYDALAITAAGKLDVGFDPINDLAPVALIGDIENWLLVNPNSQFKSVQDLIEYGKKNPGKLSFGSNGVGSSGHLAIEQINAQTGIGIVHIPYKGVTMLTDLMAGGIDGVFSSRSSTAGYVKEGKLRVIAVTGNQRSQLSPDIPSLGEQGLGAIVIPYALAAFVSSKTPKDIVDRLNKDIVKVLHQPEIAEQSKAAGLPPGDLTPEALKARIDKDVAVIADVIQKNKVSLR
jgi:tripartite-type tricarboxylate transporter receptor subunit TctC